MDHVTGNWVSFPEHEPPNGECLVLVTTANSWHCEVAEWHSLHVGNAGTDIVDRGAWVSPRCKLRELGVVIAFAPIERTCPEFLARLWRGKHCSNKHAIELARIRLEQAKDEARRITKHAEDELTRLISEEVGRCSANQG